MGQSQDSQMDNNHSETSEQKDEGKQEDEPEDDDTAKWIKELKHFPDKKSAFTFLFSCPCQKQPVIHPCPGRPCCCEAEKRIEVYQELPTGCAGYRRRQIPIFLENMDGKSNTTIHSEFATSPGFLLVSTTRCSAHISLRCRRMSRLIH